VDFPLAMPPVRAKIRMPDYADNLTTMASGKIKDWQIFPASPALGIPLH
jgi:hypothetical protein